MSKANEVTNPSECNERVERLVMRDPLNMNPPKGSKLTVSNGCLFVDGKPFVVDFPDEPMDGIEDGKLVTVFRGYLYSYWKPEDIKGYYA